MYHSLYIYLYILCIIGPGSASTFEELLEKKLRQYEVSV